MRPIAALRPPVGLTFQVTVTVIARGWEASDCEVLLHELGAVACLREEAPGQARTLIYAHQCLRSRQGLRSHHIRGRNFNRQLDKNSKDSQPRRPEIHLLDQTLQTNPQTVWNQLRCSTSQPVVSYSRSW